MQNPLQDKQISGFELGLLVESGVSKSPATAVTAPGDDRTYVRGPIVTDGSPRRLFWDQDAAAAGDNPYFPEFLYPVDPRGWKRIAIPGRWFVYNLHTTLIRPPVYVGMTGNVNRRLREHMKDKAWWPLVDRIIVDCCATREEALELEERCIHIKRPLVNIAGNCHA